MLLRVKQKINLSVRNMAERACLLVTCATCRLLKIEPIYRRSGDKENYYAINHTNNKIKLDDGRGRC